MPGRRQIRVWKVLVALTAILALLILLLPHVSNHHVTPDLVLFLTPVFLFSALSDSLTQHRARIDTPAPPQPSARPTLFQRPPPPLA
jgi:hypothetical protein